MIAHNEPLSFYVDLINSGKNFKFDCIEFLEGFIWNEHLKGDLCIK